MEYHIPKFYEGFRCLASACPDSCCKEWEVDIDEKTAEYYITLPGALGESIRKVLRTSPEGTTMRIEAGRCPMWRPDGLCEIQAQLGHEALSQVCRTFPRLRHEYGDFTELGLELSCPEAARLLLTEPYELETKILPGGEAPDYDTDAMDTLRRSREEVLAFLDGTAMTVPERLAVMLLYGHAVQEELDGGVQAQLSAEDCLADARSYASAANVDAVLDFFQNLELLTGQWKTRLEAGAVPFVWTQQHLALAKYGIYRYWFQAVSDYDLVCRVKFIIISCLVVCALGGNTVETAQLFSKEIENDPDNVDAILDSAYTDSAFTDVHLLSLLLNC